MFCITADSNVVVFSDHAALLSLSVCKKGRIYAGKEKQDNTENYNVFNTKINHYIDYVNELIPEIITVAKTSNFKANPTTMITIPISVIYSTNTLPFKILTEILYMIFLFLATQCPFH